MAGSRCRRSEVLGGRFKLVGTEWRVLDPVDGICSFSARLARAAGESAHGPNGRLVPANCSPRGRPPDLSPNSHSTSSPHPTGLVPMQQQPLPWNQLDVATRLSKDSGSLSRSVCSELASNDGISVYTVALLSPLAASADVIH